jgi:hypothetical protein
MKASKANMGKTSHWILLLLGFFAFSPTYGSPWWNCDAWPPEERHIPSEKQKQQLIAFSTGIFSPELPGDPSSYLTHNDLVKRFGRPLTVTSKERLAYDPGDPKEIVSIWKYPGFSITMVAFKTSPDKMSIEEGEISGKNVPLLFNLRIGQSIERWAKTFGKPDCSGSQAIKNEEFTLLYESDGNNYIPCSEGSCFISYAIRITVDTNGKVKRMHWSYPMM